MTDEFEAGPYWEEKTAFAPGVPEDPDAIPTLVYQVLFGRVYTRLTWKNGSVSRGEVELADLENLAGKPITKEGWYNALGEYLGAEL